MECEDWNFCHRIESGDIGCNYHTRGYEVSTQLSLCVVLYQPHSVSVNAYLPISTCY